MVEMFYRNKLDFPTCSKKTIVFWKFCSGFRHLIRVDVLYLSTHEMRPGKPDLWSGTLRTPAAEGLLRGRHTFILHYFTPALLNLRPQQELKLSARHKPDAFLSFVFFSFPLMWNIFLLAPSWGWIHFELMRLLVIGCFHLFWKRFMLDMYADDTQL